MMESLLAALKELGAKAAVAVEPGRVPTDGRFRALCARNACGYYGRCWVCPPDIGPVEALAAELAGYTKGILFTTVSPIDDAFDGAGMSRAAAYHNRITDQARALLRARLPGRAVLALGAGACGLCPVCARIDDLPCRCPDRAVSSLEAYGVDVAALARGASLPSVPAPGTVTYFGMILWQDRE